MSIRTRSLGVLLISLMGCSWAIAQAAAETKEEASSKKKTKPGVVAVFQMRGAVLETPAADDPLNAGQGESLKDLVARLEAARDDEDVKALAIMMGGASMGSAQLEELHGTIKAIRDDHKPVYFYGDNLSFGGLALASAGSQISVAPVGDVMILGLYGEQLYLRGLLEKLHVRPDYSTCGAYKSAAELFMREGPSEAAAEMQNWLFDSLFECYVNQIATGRGVSADKVKGWIDEGVYTAGEAVELGIIDKAEVHADFANFLKQTHGEDIKLDFSYGKKEKGKVDLSNPFAFLKIWAEMLESTAEGKSDESVAIVYVEGPIVPGQPDPSPFGSQNVAYSDPIRKALDKAAEDDSVKAVVLRVNSPGGSAVASEIILQATKRVAAKKPFVVSMGNVAGSGGYYVSCGTDTIFADKSTITASIGVVTGKLATREMWKQMGIQWHPISRGRNSGMLASGDMFTDEQRDLMQNFMDDIYGDFKDHVLAARGDRLKKPIEQLAEGRVFTGQQALELGLVDKIGTLDDAIAFAAERAHLDDDDFDVRVIPKPKNFMEQLMEELSGKKEEEGTIRLGLWSQLEPWLQGLQPHRANAIRQAIVQLEVMQRESVSLMTPEFLISP